MNVMSVSLLRLQNGDIALLLFKEELNRGLHTDAAYLQDEAQSWSDPVPCITDRQGYFVL